MIKKSQFIAAAALLVLASCTTSDETFEGIDLAQEAAQENAIQFGTYLGNQVETRAGYKGSYNTDILKGFDAASGGTWTEEQAKAQGFGVFAYYTGTYTYGQQQGSTYTAETNTQSDIAANFMFNQQVWWNNSAEAGLVTKWTYSPMKFWPNEISSTADTADDTQTSAATGSGEFGGNVSFFAYAPYVTLSSTAIDATDGITAINGQTTLSEAQGVTGDPKITYVVANDGNVVDLLWGTFKSASAGVTENANTGVPYNSSAAANTYAKSILPSYTLNADLTKQKTQGKVDFAFKHALAKIGGSEIYSPLTGDVKHGLLIQLDIDDQKGAVNGGTKEDATKVTVRSIKIEGAALVNDGTNNPGTASYTETYLKKQQGTLNLATGVWDVLTETSNKTTNRTEAGITTHEITTAGNDDKLVTDIAEPITAPDKTEAGFNGLPNGVLTTAQNVYQSEAAPLVFIPNTWPELKITVDYIVRTKDANLANAYSEVEQKITKTITFLNAVELNKQYNLLIHLGLTSVKFDATVSNWVVDGDTNGDGTIGTGESVVKTDVHVPINVQ